MSNATTGLTLRMIHDITCGDGLECLLAVSGIARSMSQGEGTTFDGDCATALKILETFDRPPAAAVAAFIDALGEAADVPIPDVILKTWLSDGEEENEHQLPPSQCGDGGSVSD